MERPPNIDDLAPDIRYYIEHLEQKIKDTEEDGVRGFLIVINRKMNQIKRSIDNYEFKINNVEDRAFERFWSATLKFKELTRDLEEMKKTYKLTEEELVDDKIKLNPMERMAYEKNKGKGDR